MWDCMLVDGGIVTVGSPLFGISMISLTSYFVSSSIFTHSSISIQPYRPGLAVTRAQSCDR